MELKDYTTEELEVELKKRDITLKFTDYIQKLAKAYDINLPHRGYDIYAFAEDLLAWLEKQGEQAPSQTNERAWLYLVSDVLTWKDGIGQYLDDPRVQELAKKLCNKYSQKLYNPSNYSNTGKNEQKSVGKIEPKFKIGDWIVFNKGKGIYKVEKIENYEYTLRHILGGSMPLSFSGEGLIRKWTFEDAKDGDVFVHSSFMFDDFIFIYNNTSVLQAYCYYSNERNRFIIEDRGHPCPWNMQEVTPATKEQRDLLFTKMEESGYKWDFNKKKLIKIEDEPENYKQQIMSEINDVVEEYIDWLKSLKTKIDDKLVIQEAKKYYSDNINAFDAFLHGVEFAEGILAQKR